MNPDVKDILLVLLGAAGSFLGTALTLFFGLRRDRHALRYERKVKEYEKLIAFLSDISRLNNVMFLYFEAHILKEEEKRHAYFVNNVEPMLNLISQAPFNGIATNLMTRNRRIAKKLVLIGNRLVDIRLMLEYGVNVYQPDFLAQEKQKIIDLNNLLEGLFNDIERDLNA
ncbi:MAG: hypothetical protein H0X30_25325 [Anaerolineae bacterium]|nr:hypothetical protein [Anaerolineae bacterium]